MAVYIGTREYKYGRMIMSHMAADTLEELHQMAQSVGVAKRHYQGPVILDFASIVMALAR